MLLKEYYTAKTAEDCQKLAHSLAQTLYHPHTTVLLLGDRGSGKTTFVQGLARGLGVTGRVTSPSFAIEHRYGDTLIHIDCERVPEKELPFILLSSSESCRVRAIESMPGATFAIDEPTIVITIDDARDASRTLAVEYRDMPLPDDHTIDAYRRDIGVLPNIAEHMDTVTKVARSLAVNVKNNGTIVRMDALKAACKLHDLFRFVDFKELPAGLSTLQRRQWNDAKIRYGSTHERAAENFLKEKGFAELGAIIRTHGAPIVDDGMPMTTEQLLLSYADKRVLHTSIVTLDERFDDFLVRYGGGNKNAFNESWRRAMKDIEQTLFAKNVPSSDDLRHAIASL
jgi:tRNA threonylcarbamoyl adenosine modification protein YjeE